MTKNGTQLRGFSTGPTFYNEVLHFDLWNYIWGCSRPATTCSFFKILVHKFVRNWFTKQKYWSLFQQNYQIKLLIDRHSLGSVVYLPLFLSNTIIYCHSLQSYFVNTSNRIRVFALEIFWSLYNRDLIYSIMALTSML